MLEKQSPELWIRNPSALGQSLQNEYFVANYYGDKYQNLSSAEDTRTSEVCLGKDGGQQHF
jgi:hypothetical protein